ncbi:MAG: hypothetical protein ACK4OP_12110 [Gemmobacter sp.]
MSRARRLAELAALAAMLRDARLGTLAGTAARRDAVLGALAALEAPEAAPEGMDPLAAARAGLLHQRWADERRRALTIELARRTAVWMEARSKAVRDLGRAAALGRLAQDARPRRD